MADVEMQRLVVSLEARIRTYERGLEKARTGTNDAMRQISASVAAAEKRIEAFGSRSASVGVELASTMSRLAAPVLAAVAFRDVARMSGQFVQLQNQLRMTGIEGDQLNATMAQLFRSAQDKGAALGPLVTLYARLSQSQAELGASNSDVMRFADGVATALKVAGTDATAASGALLQLSQALGGSIVRAEEFNSINEGARPILSAVAQGLEAAGGSVAKLRALVLEGKVSSQDFFAAFLRGLPSLEAAAGKATGTVDQGFTRIDNALTMLVGHLDQVTGASANAAGSLSGIAAVIEGLPAYVDATAGGWQGFNRWLDEVGNHPVWREIGELMGGDYSPEGMARAGLVPVKNGVPTVPITGGGFGDEPPTEAARAVEGVTEAQRRLAALVEEAKSAWSGFGDAAGAEIDSMARAFNSGELSVEGLEAALSRLQSTEGLPADFAAQVATTAREIDAARGKVDELAAALRLARQEKPATLPMVMDGTGGRVGVAADNGQAQKLLQSLIGEAARAAKAVSDTRAQVAGLVDAFAHAPDQVSGLVVAIEAIAQAGQVPRDVADAIAGVADSALSSRDKVEMLRSAVDALESRQLSVDYVVRISQATGTPLRQDGIELPPLNPLPGQFATGLEDLQRQADLADVAAMRVQRAQAAREKALRRAYGLESTSGGSGRRSAGVRLSDRLAELNQDATVSGLSDIAGYVVRTAQSFDIAKPKIDAYIQAIRTGAPVAAGDMKLIEDQVRTLRDAELVKGLEDAAFPERKLTEALEALERQAAKNPQIAANIEALRLKAFEQYGGVTWVDDMSSAISGFARTAVMDFRNVGDAASKLANRLVEIALDETLFKPLEASLRNLFSGMSGGGGGIFGSIMGLFGGSGLAPSSTFFADGGYVRGPGGGRSDSILAAVSNGEFVINAAATARHRPMLEAINAGRLPRVPAFANGGLVGSVASRSLPALPASGGGRGVALSVNVAGARGNAEIQSMVAAGIAQGLGSYDKALAGRIKDLMARGRV